MKLFFLFWGQNKDVTHLAGALLLGHIPPLCHPPPFLLCLPHSLLFSPSLVSFPLFLPPHFVFWQRVLLCSRSWPGSHCAQQATLRLAGSPRVSASRVSDDHALQFGFPCQISFQSFTLNGCFLTSMLE